MIQLKCKEIIVKFKNNHAAQRISSTDQSRAEYLLVHQDADTLAVYYSKQTPGIGNEAIKLIAFNFREIVEYAIEGIVSPTVDKPTPTPAPTEGKYRANG